MNLWSDSDSETAATRNPLETPKKGTHAQALHAASLLLSAERSPTPQAAEAGRHQPVSRRIVLDHDDVYDGEILVERGVAVPHGRGTLTSAAGQHTYVGYFAHRWRDGYGRLEAAGRYTLWCKWRMNRPDLADSARIDYPNGDKYCGFLSLRQDTAATRHRAPSSSGSISKFSAWVLSTTPIRQRWGEIACSSGDRYFGEWAEDRPHGFGCYTTRAGDRYVGRFLDGRFHDTGTLFSTAGESEGRQQLLQGVRFGPGGGSSSSPLSGAACAGPLPALEPRRVHILDGVWHSGKFAGEGHMTLANGVRITAEWKGANQPYAGEVVLPPPVHAADAEAEVHVWRECFHWEPLLCGMYAEIRQKEFAACSAFRTQLLAHAPPRESYKHTLQDFLSNSSPVRNALKIFRRCFYYHYGSCGNSSEVGSGRGRNQLGWCYLRNAYGGCIHPSRGRIISRATLDVALDDILSFARSVQRWVVEMCGPEHEDTFAACGGATIVGRWVADEVLHDLHDVLLNLYAHVYDRAEDCLSKSLEQMRGSITLDDMGVQFGRQHSQERLFDHYSDATHCIEGLNQGGSRTLTAKLRILVQWSKDIDVSTRLAYAGAEETAAGWSRATTGKEGGRTTAPPQSGSADDLLPIHQYVISQSRIQRLYSHSRLLADFAAVPDFMDPSSQESFCVTTFQVCVLILMKLHPALRDDRECVLVPISLYADRVVSCIGRLSASGGRWDALAKGYLKSWVPQLLLRLAASPSALSVKSSVVLTGSHAVFMPDKHDIIALSDGSIPPEAQVCCWTLAGSVLSITGLSFQLKCGGGQVHSFAMGTDCDQLLLPGGIEAAPMLSVCTLRPILPSALLYLSDTLSGVL